MTSAIAMVVTFVVPGVAAALIVVATGALFVIRGSWSRSEPLRKRRGSDSGRHGWR